MYICWVHVPTIDIDVDGLNIFMHLTVHTATSYISLLIYLMNLYYILATRLVRLIQKWCNRRRAVYIPWSAWNNSNSGGYRRKKTTGESHWWPHQQALQVSVMQCCLAVLLVPSDLICTFCSVFIVLQVCTLTVIQGFDNRGLWNLHLSPWLEKQ